jgi:hypothetical protein
MGKRGRERTGHRTGRTIREQIVHDSGEDRWNLNKFDSDPRHTYLDMDEDPIWPSDEEFIWPENEDPDDD